MSKEEKISKLKELDFNKMTDKELVQHLAKSNGEGSTGSHRKGKFYFHGPDWDDDYNPLTRKQVIEELEERRKLNIEEDEDWFDYLVEE